MITKKDSSNKKLDKMSILLDKRYGEACKERDQLTKANETLHKRIMAEVSSLLLEIDELETRIGKNAMRIHNLGFPNLVQSYIRRTRLAS